MPPYLSQARSAKAETVLQDKHRRFSRDRALTSLKSVWLAAKPPGDNPRGQVGRIMRLGKTDHTMIEILFMYQLARNPLRAIARRWWCRSLYRVSRGRRHCPECPNS
jgi:hypothetical protein